MSPLQEDNEWVRETKYSFSHLFHSVVGHSLMGICQFFGATKLGDWAHDATLPKKYRN